jgi:hypothetical protein
LRWPSRCSLGTLPRFGRRAQVMDTGEHQGMNSIDATLFEG